MPFEVCDCVGAIARAFVSTSQGDELALNLGASDAAATVGGDAPAAYHGIDSPAHHESVLVAHEDNNAAAFAGPKACRARVVDAHRIDGERASLSEPHQFEWVGAQVNSASDGHLQIPGSQRRAGIYDCEE